MKVFISWSGNKSHQVGLVFREWLPSVIQSVEPYVSSEDIDKGARWSTDIAKELENSSFGILCVTKENLEAPWLSFEAGALSKTMDKAFVSPFLFDIKRSEVNGPILQFQSTIFDKEDIKKLLVTLNKACGEAGISDARLDKAFEVWYPSLEAELNKLKDAPEATVKEMPKSIDTPSYDIIEEILELSRDNQKILKNPNNGNIEDIRQKMDLILSHVQRTTDEGRSVSRQRAIYLDEFIHYMIPKCQREYRLLIGLNLLNDFSPWLYGMGQELVNMIKSNYSLEVKKEVLNNFKSIFEFTFEHPMMRSLARTQNRMIMREIPYIIMGVLKEYEMELDELSNDVSVDKEIVIPTPVRK